VPAENKRKALPAKQKEGTRPSRAQITRGYKRPAGKHCQRVQVASGFAPLPAKLKQGTRPCRCRRGRTKVRHRNHSCKPTTTCLSKTTLANPSTTDCLDPLPPFPPEISPPGAEPFPQLFSSSWDTLIIYNSIYSKQGIYCPTQFTWRKLHRTAHRRPTLGPPICGQTIVLLMSKSGPFTENNGQPS